MLWDIGLKLFQIDFQRFIGFFNGNVYGIGENGFSKGI